MAGVLVRVFFSRFGIPGELHSDQGREFQSKVFQQCSELLGVHQMRTTPLHPQSDGMVERFNRTLAEELAKYCSSDQQPVVAVYLDGIPVSAAGGYRLHSRQDDAWSGDAAAAGPGNWRTTRGVATTDGA